MEPQARRVGWYKRLYAYAMAHSSEYNERLAGRKRDLLGRLHGSVLEIGAGTAPNLAFFAPDVRWLGIDPNPAMFPYAQQEAQRQGMSIELREGKAEQLPLSSDSMDAVVSTTVLCTVRDPALALQEILRVLKPGGQFVFIEHVAAPRQTPQRRRQHFVRPLWSLCTDGCHPDRETWTLIESAGFSTVQIDFFQLPIPFVGPHIAGYATK